MNVSCTRKIASRLSTGIAILALLLGTALPLRADDQKDKKKNSTTSTPAPKPAPTPKADKGSRHSGGSSTSSSTGGNSGSAGGTQDTVRHKNRGTDSTSSSSDTSSTGTGTTHHEKHKGSDSTTGTGSGGTGTTSGTVVTGESTRHREKNKSSDSTGGGSTGTTTSGGASSSSSAGAAATGGTGERSGKHKGTNTSTGVVTTESANVTAGSKHKNGKEPAILVPGLKRAANGKPEAFRSRDGSEARFSHDGHLREVRTREMTIYHGPRGFRRVVVERPDHSRIVVNRFGHGYVQRPFNFRGHEFAARTYYYNGRPYALYYQRYPYRGLYLDGYRPYRYYYPGYYGWAYHPWRSPVRYSWGWFGSPWYGHYNYYFQPYSFYPSASFWLTDYLISTSLQNAYLEQRLAGQNSYYADPAPGSVVLTPEVKDAIASEVQNQIAIENAESQSAVRGGDIDINSSSLPRILAETSERNPHIFVVFSPVTVTDTSGQDCMLTEGDVLRLGNPPPADATFADLRVYASKNKDCPKGSTVSVGLADLQDMQNHLRSGIDQGLQEMQSNQGGLPAPPASAVGTTVQASFSQIAPPPDPNVSGELQRQARDASTADQAVLNEAKQTDSSIGADVDTSASSPVQISVGQTINEVRAVMGNPTRIAKAGAKVIYVYPDMKITFINGKVSDVE